MTAVSQIYRCPICGNIVEVLHSGAGALVCCGQEMELLDPKEKDEGLEKHVPVVERENGKVRVKVSSVEHPMEEEHYIEFIELLVDGRVYRQFLSPGDKPEAVFEVDGEEMNAREYCNIHGLWKS
ncbi:desulfoferrodoxin [Candidatus Dojkabacteria bacterium]|nr:desulfoferrodoxin [Candidatus Dojkabacteria bacterium]